MIAAYTELHSIGTSSPARCKINERKGERERGQVLIHVDRPFPKDLKNTEKLHRLFTPVPVEFRHFTRISVYSVSPTWLTGKLRGNEL